MGEPGSLFVLTTRSTAATTGEDATMDARTPMFSFGSMISDSPVMTEVFTAADLAMATGEPVCFFGESGVGLHTLARNITHGKLVELHTGTVPAALIPHEFDAARARAAGGTFVLTGLSDLPEGSQREVARAIDARERNPRWIVLDYQPPHGATLVPELRAALARSSVRVPPLRERDDDAALLAEHFLRVFNLEFDRSFEGLSPCALTAIRDHAWPGNVRELYYTVMRWVLMWDGVDGKEALLDPCRA